MGLGVGVAAAEGASGCVGDEVGGAMGVVGEAVGARAAGDCDAGPDGKAVAPPSGASSMSPLAPAMTIPATRRLHPTIRLPITAAPPGLRAFPLVMAHEPLLLGGVLDAVHRVAVDALDDHRRHALAALPYVKERG